MSPIFAVPELPRQAPAKIFSLVVQDTEVLTESLKEFATEFPQLMRPLIQERDEYMVFLLRTLATRYDPYIPCTAHLIHQAVQGIHDSAYAS